MCRAAADPIHSLMWPYHPDLLARAVPRYTSFPTAAEFTDDVGETDLADALEAIVRPISVYAHIPFCEQICWYCGCNTGASNRAHRLQNYLDALDAEIKLVAARLPQATGLSRIAFGGGSPNAISPLAFVRLLDRIVTAFGSSTPLISIELDPRTLNRQWIGMLGSAGISHASLGVQTFAPHIQQAIGRVQPQEIIDESVANLRAAGVRSLNFDLMYGLPGQRPEDLAATLDHAIALGPDRIALFGYAHVPDMLPRQRRIDASDLPGQEQRFRMAYDGFARLVAAGYRPVGFDHFALPHDRLAKAEADGTLRRNFQGFTDDDAVSLIGLGASAISLFAHVMVQNEKNTGAWRTRIGEGRLTGTRGIRRSLHDRRLAAVIEDIVCGRATDLCLLGQDEAVAEADRRLAPFLARGLIERDGSLLLPTATTRPYARSIAALFDPYRLPVGRQFSSAV
jgi:oxygen-independent coproporphyrinogen III oxidase